MNAPDPAMLDLLHDQAEGNRPLLALNHLDEMDSDTFADFIWTMDDPEFCTCLQRIAVGGEAVRAEASARIQKLLRDRCEFLYGDELVAKATQSEETI